MDDDTGFFCIGLAISSTVLACTLPNREDDAVVVVAAVEEVEEEDEEGMNGRVTRCGLANVGSSTVLSIEPNRLDAPISCFHSIPPFDSVIPRPNPDGVGKV